MLARLRERWTLKRYASGRLVFIEHQRPWGPRTLRRAGRRKYGYHHVIVKVQFGPGRGYCRWSDDRTKVLVHGRGAHFAWRSGSRQWQSRFRWPSRWIDRFPIEIGFGKRCTTPYLSH